MNNLSPWIHQLNRSRPAIPLDRAVDTDIVIVGAGIAGIATAYFLLRDTDKKVVMLEADKVAHGATGHNAGQITSYFERPLASLVEEYGLDLASRGQESIESAWGLLETIHHEAGLVSQFYRFTGHAGCCTFEQLLAHLENNYHREQSRRLDLESILVAEEAPYIKKIPKKYANLYATIPHADLLEILETRNASYTAIISYEKGCMNSALFSEELALYMKEKYQDRFLLYEASPVTTVALAEDSARLHVLDHEVRAKRVVLCTNGFENFSIINEAGEDIDTRFHHTIEGTIGYMAGYFEPLDRDPIAISYFPDAKEGEEEFPYFYLTRRPHDTREKKQHNLLCIGGPEATMPDTAVYSREDEYNEDVRRGIDEFLNENYRHTPPEKTQYAFLWHGLMGYTTSKVRLIGPEPVNPVLLYNLGCNGVGILPSLFGGKRISEILGDVAVSPSIFDPKKSML